MTYATEAVLLDLDGTLIDTEPFYQRIWKATAADCHIDLDDAIYQQFIGQRLEECFRLIATRGGKNFDLPHFKRQLEAKEAEGWQTGIDCKPGSHELLRFIREHQIPMALVTSAGRARVIQVMQHFSWFNYFQVIITGDDVENPKPAPTPYLNAMQQLDSTPAACLALEDSNTGMRSALRAGCRTIMIPDLEKPAQDVREKANAILPDLFGVIDYMTQR